MTAARICKAKGVTSFSGSFDVVRPSDLPPDDVLARCSLCDNASPVWWYALEPVTDELGRLVGPTALARWWAICTDCDRLIASGAVKDARERRAESAGAADVEEVDELLLRGERWGRVTS